MANTLAYPTHAILPRTIRRRRTNQYVNDNVPNRQTNGVVAAGVQQPWGPVEVGKTYFTNQQAIHAPILYDPNKEYLPSTNNRGIATSVYNVAWNNTLGCITWNGRNFYIKPFANGSSKSYTLASTILEEDTAARQVVKLICNFPSSDDRKGVVTTRLFIYPNCNMLRIQNDITVPEGDSSDLGIQFCEALLTNAKSSQGTSTSGYNSAENGTWTGWVLSNNMLVSIRDAVEMYPRGYAIGDTTQLDTSGSLFTGCQAWWEFNESSGLRYGSVGSNTLIDQYSSFTRVSGKVGYGINNAGVLNSLYVADNTSLSITGDMTISCWVKLDSKSTSSVIVSKMDQNDITQRSFLLFYDKNQDHFRFMVTAPSTGGATVAVTSTVSPAIGTWYHILAKHNNGANIKIRVSTGSTPDTEFTTTHTTGIADSTCPFQIGNTLRSGSPDATGSYYLNGTIDQMIVWSRSISDAEFATIFAAGQGYNIPTATNSGLKLFHHFNNGTRVNEADLAYNEVVKLKYLLQGDLNPTYPSEYVAATTATAYNITGASNATPIQITEANHGLLTGEKVVIASVGGNTAANGTWSITVTGTNTYTLDTSVGSGTYTSGGTRTRLAGTQLWDGGNSATNAAAADWGGISTTLDILVVFCENTTPPDSDIDFYHNIHQTGPIVSHVKVPGMKGQFFGEIETAIKRNILSWVGPWSGQWLYGDWRQSDTNYTRVRGCNHYYNVSTSLLHFLRTKDLEILQSARRQLVHWRNTCVTEWRGSGYNTARGYIYFAHPGSILPWNHFIGGNQYHHSDVQALILGWQVDGDRLCKDKLEKWNPTSWQIGKDRDTANTLTQGQYLKDYQGQDYGVLEASRASVEADPKDIRDATNVNYLWNFQHRWFTPEWIKQSSYIYQIETSTVTMIANMKYGTPERHYDWLSRIAVDWGTAAKPGPVTPGDLGWVNQWPEFVEDCHRRKIHSFPYYYDMGHYPHKRNVMLEIIFTKPTAADLTITLAGGSNGGDVNQCTVRYQRPDSTVITLKSSPNYWPIYNPTTGFIPHDHPLLRGGSQEDLTITGPSGQYRLQITGDVSLIWGPITPFPEYSIVTAGSFTKFVEGYFKPSAGGSVQYVQESSALPSYFPENRLDTSMYRQWPTAGYFAKYAEWLP